MPTIDHYITPLKFPMSIDLFSRFPTLAGYKAELKGGNVELTYRPRLSMARLRVTARKVHDVESVLIRPLDLRSGQEPLAKLFATSFAHMPPLDTMAPTTRRHAADAAMKHTAGGGDGPVIAEACLSAFDRASHKLIGAAIVSEIRLRADEWPEIELPKRLPNLTWIFVSPEHQRRGVGMRLLGGVVAALQDLEMPWLVSHIAPDNPVSLLFHWRAGFELVSRVAGAYDGGLNLKKA